MKRELVISKDGSHTLFVPEMGEHYHSLNGAVTESEHVFIKNGLAYYINHFLPIGQIKIVEFGFGTGLNALKTAEYAIINSNTIEYLGIELYPIDAATLTNINYGLNNVIFEQLHTAKWGNMVAINDTFSIHKQATNFQSFSSEAAYNIIYYDAFAPKYQPELWTEEIFRRLYKALLANGILVTYCASTRVRQALENCGFWIQELAGANGKAEMTRAIKF